jgi:hypothetical protein
MCECATVQYAAAVARYFIVLTRGNYESSRRWMI